MASTYKMNLFRIVLLSFMSTPILGKKCPSITINKGMKNTTFCVTTSGTVDNLYNVLTTCPYSQECPWIDYSSTRNLTCRNSTFGAIRNYPGLPCSNDNDCIDAGKCTSAKVCQYVDENRACTSSQQCKIGLACFIKTGGPGISNSSTCQKQVGNGAICTEDAQCLNTHGCNFGKCVEYFSLGTGSLISSDLVNSKLSLCASALYDPETKRCISTTSLDNAFSRSCGEDTLDCNYNIEIAKNSTINQVLANTCECTYTTDREKRCYLGTNNNYTKAYIKQIKVALSELKKCHGTERTYSCNAYSGYVTYEEFDMLSSLYMLDWLRDNGHKVVGLGIEERKDLFNVTFMPYAYKMKVPGDTSKPRYTNVTFTSSSYQCPTFQCAPGRIIRRDCATQLVNRTYPFGMVTLYKTCDSLSEYCQIKSPSVFTQRSKNVTYSCASRSYQYNHFYAGEECTGIGTGNCANSMECDGRCVGNATGETCNATAFCNAGSYCGSGKCTKQKTENASCADSTECLNNLVCNSMKCVPLFSVEVGGVIAVSAEDEKLFSISNYMCKSGRTDKAGKVCVSRSYPYKNQTGVIECLPGHSCNYIESAGAGVKYEVSEPCLCGFNKDGKAYCPISDDDNIKEAEGYRTKFAEYADNKCHTLNRFKCPTAGNKMLFSYNHNYHTSAQYHLYNGAVECAEQVLDSAYIGYNIIFLFIILSLLF